MKNLSILFCFVFLIISGCKNNSKQDGQENTKPYMPAGEVWAYFNEELDVQAAVTIDTSILRNELNKIVPSEKIFDLYGSGYQNFYLRLMISPDNKKSFVIFPDATYLDRNTGISGNPLWEQDVKYELHKEKIFFSNHADENNIFTTTPGSLKGNKVKCLKVYEIHVFLGKNKTISRQWDIHETSIIKYRPDFLGKNVDEYYFGGNIPVTGKDVFDGIRKKIVYPEEALKKGVTGRVFVKLFADEDGNYAGYKLVKGLGFGCDEAVISAIKSAKFQGYPFGRKGAVLIPFEFGTIQTNPIDLAVAKFDYNPDKNVYCNMYLEIVNKNEAGKKINRVYWVYAYIDNKLAFSTCCFGGISESYKQQTFWFPWKPNKPGTYEYVIYIDPENRLNDSNRENNTVKGTLTVN